MDTNLPLTPEALVQQLRTLRDQIPGYAPLAPAAAARLVRTSAVGTAFIDAAINTLGASLAVQSSLGTTPEVLRREADESARWTAVADELRALLDGVLKTNLARRHRLNLTALQTYNISRQLLRQGDNANLRAHVQEMKRQNPFGRRRATRDAAKTQPPPATT